MLELQVRSVRVRLLYQCMFLLLMDRGINISSRVEVIDDEVLLPAMLDAVAYNTVAKTMDREGGGTARFSFRIDGRGNISGPINVQRENMYYAAAGIGKTDQSGIGRSRNDF